MAEQHSKTIGTVARAVADNRIVIIVEGGVVQDVFGVPKGSGLEVHDYDVEGCEDSHLETNDDGDRFVRAVWREPDGKFTPPDKPTDTPAGVYAELLELCDEAQAVCDAAADWIGGNESYDVKSAAGSLKKLAIDLRAAVANAKRSAD